MWSYGPSRSSAPRERNGVSRVLWADLLRTAVTREPCVTPGERESQRNTTLRHRPIAAHVSLLTRLCSDCLWSGLT